MAASFLATTSLQLLLVKLVLNYLPTQCVGLQTLATSAGSCRRFAASA